MRWLRRLLQPEGDAVIDTKITPPRQLFTGHDDALRLRTQARRKAADTIRTRASHVETGAPVSDVLRRIK